MLLVRMRGLEPPRCHHHRLLRPARLPVPPHPQRHGESHYANAFRECQEGSPLHISAFLCASAVISFYDVFTAKAQRNAEIRRELESGKLLTCDADRGRNRDYDDGG